MPSRCWHSALLVSCLPMFCCGCRGLCRLTPSISGQSRCRRIWHSTRQSRFSTNTNWQSYAPDSTLSYFSNMVALAIHNWMSAATGIAIAIALVRGFARRSAEGIGNFWVDVTRATLYVLLPISFFFALFLVQQGVPQNFAEYTKANRAGRRLSDHRAGTGRLAGSDQDAGDKRRRVL